MGGRLRYRDAIALWENLSADSRSYTGMTAMHMAMPLDATAIILSLQCGSDVLLGDLAPEKAKKKRVEVTDEERQAALQSMSSIFGFEKQEKSE